MAVRGEEETAVPGEPRQGAGVFFVVVVLVLMASTLTRAPARLPFTVCLFHNLTGLPCPGCGMTRGFVAMGHGRIAEAWTANPFSPFVFVAACVYVVWFLGCAVGLRIRAPGIPRRLVLAFCVLVGTLVLTWWGVAVKRELRAPQAGPATLRSWITSMVSARDRPRDGRRSAEAPDR